MVLNIYVLISMLTGGCSTIGKLEYIDEQGIHKTACDTQYSGDPQVDKYAVEFVLAHCAKQATAKGYQVIDESLLNIDMTIKPAPIGKTWSFELATLEYKNKQLTAKQYGYIIAFIDLKLD